MIVPTQLCSGCHACYSVCPQKCIVMAPDDEGFLYPQVNSRLCIECGQCRQVCPALSGRQGVRNEPVAYGAYCNDEGLLTGSSSGGMFSLLAQRVINEGGVVFGAGFDGDFSVAHSFSQTGAQTRKFMGSKYVQSAIGDSYRQAKEFLSAGKKVYFSGTPCQIGGLLSFLGDRHDNLYTQDFICHGVPSPKVWKKYLAFREGRAGARATDITFRRKEFGWEKFCLWFLFENAAEYIEDLNSDIYMRAFLKDICLRPSCHNCAFKGNARQSDITIADFWGVKAIEPGIYNKNGVSLVIVNSARGQEMFDGIKPQIRFMETNLDRAIRLNMAALRPSAAHPNRKAFFEHIDQQPFDELVRNYCKDSGGEKIRKFIIAALAKTGLSDFAKKIKAGLGI